jgi:hypothetical protein
MPTRKEWKSIIASIPSHSELVGVRHLGAYLGYEILKDYPMNYLGLV